MIQNKQLSEIEFSEAIKRTPTYKGFERFKQGLTSRRSKILNLYDKYQQAQKHGIGYLKQNPNVFANDINMINDVLNEE